MAQGEAEVLRLDVAVAQRQSSRVSALLIQELDAFAIKQDSVKIRTSFTPRPEHAPRIAFVMSGQGPQWWGMGRELMEHEPVFRQAIEAGARSPLE